MTTATDTPERITAPEHFTSAQQARAKIKGAEAELTRQMGLGKTGPAGDLLDPNVMVWENLTLGSTPEESKTRFGALSRDITAWKREYNDYWVGREADDREADRLALEGLKPDGKAEREAKPSGPKHLLLADAVSELRRKWDPAVHTQSVSVPISAWELAGVPELALAATGASTEPLTDTEVAKPPLDLPAFYEALVKRPVTNSTIVYMALGTQTNAAAGRTSIGAGGQSTLGYVRRTATVRNTGHVLDVPEDLFDDEAYARAEIPDDMRAMTLEKVNEDLTTGDGTSNAISGLAATRANTLTRAGKQANTPIAVEVALAIGQVEDENQGGGMPNTLMLNSVRYWDMSSEGLGTAYAGGWAFPMAPTSGAANPWGLQRLIRNAALGANDGYVLTLTPRNMHFALRQAATLEMSREAGWKTWEVVVRSQLRGELVVKRPQSFVKLTTLNT